MTIVTAPYDPLVPGLYAGMQFSADVINATWDQANTKVTAFEAKVDDIQNMLVTGIADITADVANETEVVEPTVTIPTDVSVTDVMSTFDAKYQQLIAMLVDKFTGFQTAYFPNDAVLYGKAEDWISAAIDDPSGIPAAVKAQMLSDESDVILAEASRASDAALATFAARRFPMPPGAAASAVIQINQKAQDSIAESARKITVASVENLKFAIEKALLCRQTAMNAALDYIKALMSSPDLAARMTGVGYDAQSKLISAVTGFYGARIDANKLVKQAEQFNVTTKLHKDEKNLNVDVMMVEEKVKVLLSEAQAIAQMATALFNNLHASSGVSTTRSS